ncbi:MAG: polysaccharide biosynthesis/export family protein [Bacteroidales bacterium]|nr:polysaccharide biosynthesis/export family protein [Bacteroidales bacterium]
MAQKELTLRHWLCTILLTTAMLLVSGCYRVVHLPYVYDAPRNENIDIAVDYTVHIQPNDLLYIHVNSLSDEAAIPFNQETNHSDLPLHEVNGYTVSPQGTIYFPQLGTLHVAGLSTDSIGHLIETQLSRGGFLTDATVYVRLMNFKVTVIGQVRTPQQVPASGQRLTVLEAIARCGDIKPDGLANHVTVLRTINDSIVADTLDLTSHLALNSPFYYLQPNDIIYVEPDDNAKRKSLRNDEWQLYGTTTSSAVRYAYSTIIYVRRIYQNTHNR